MMGNLNFNGTNPDYSFYTLEKKLNLGVFHTKEELINEINRLNDFYKNNGMDLSYYAGKIEKLLKLFDEKYTNNNDLDLSNLKKYAHNEIVILKDGSSKINITKTTTYNNNPVTENERTLESYSEEETKEKMNISSNKSVLNPLEQLDYLVKNYDNIDYILNSYNIPEEQKQMYKKMAYEEYMKIKEEQRMNEMNKQNKPKVYEYQNKEGRNGFVNAFLITIITTLFGGLCLAYMIFSIANM